MKYSVATRSVDHVLRGVESLDSAQDGYCKAKEMYEGNPPEVIGDGVVARKLRKTYGEYVFRLAKTPVDYMSDRVKIVKVTANDPTADEAIDQIDHGNSMNIWGPTTNKSAFIKGDAYILVTPIAPDDADEDDEIRQAGVRFTMLNAENTRAIYDDLGRDAVFVVRNTTLQDKRRVIEVYYGDGVAVWITTGPNADVHNPISWVPLIESETPEGWYSYPFEGTFQIPIFHVRADTFLDSPYGKPEHYDAFGAQNAINSALLTQIETMKEMGFAQRYMIEKDDAEDNSSGIDFGAVHGDPVVGATLPDRGQVGGPGTILNDPRAASYGQFTTSGPENFLNPVDFYIRLMSQETNTPLYAFDPSKDMSGISRQNADAPLKDKIKNRTTRLSAVWAKVYKFALALKGIDVDRVEIKWQNEGIAFDALDAAGKVADMVSKFNGILPAEMVQAMAVRLLDETLELDIQELMENIAAVQQEQKAVATPAEDTQTEQDIADDSLDQAPNQ